MSEGCPDCIAERQASENALAIADVEAQDPGTDVQAVSWYQEATRLQEYAEARVIKTLDDLKTANDDLTIISRLKKAMDDRRKELKKPLKETQDKIEADYKFWMEPVFNADRITRDKMMAYTREQEHIRREQEEINRKRQEAAEAEMRLTGELSEPVNLVEVIPEPAKRVSTDMGTSGMRDNWKWEVVDFKLVPDDYKMINAGVLTPIIKASKGKITIPGIRIFNEPIMAVNTR